jgi:hypothetical protein
MLWSRRVSWSFRRGVVVAIGGWRWAVVAVCGVWGFVVGGGTVRCSLPFVLFVVSLSGRVGVAMPLLLHGHAAALLSFVGVICGWGGMTGPGLPSSFWSCDGAWVDIGWRGLTRLWPSPFVAIVLRRVDATSLTVTWPQHVCSAFGGVTWPCHVVAVVIGVCRGVVSGP